MIRTPLTLCAALLALGIVLSAPIDAAAQGKSGRLNKSLSELSADPRYSGRVLGTHIRKSGGRKVYEVRILRPNDRILLVYIDPKTGRVVGESGRKQ
jgi:uncharacterized membrane protein YkoI